MDIIKQCRRETIQDGYTYQAIAIVRTNTYGNSLDLITSLFETAKRDFPELTMPDVKVVVWGGDRVKNMTGLEFQLPLGTVIPSNYQAISSLPPLK